MHQVYLIHFEHKYKHARHYIGMTNNLDNRLACHHNGSGAKLLQVINQKGIDWAVMRTWECESFSQARQLEKRLKSWHGSGQICPHCNPKAMERANYELQNSECEIRPTLQNENLPF